MRSRRSFKCRRCGCWRLFRDAAPCGGALCIDCVGSSRFRRWLLRLWLIAIVAYLSLLAYALLTGRGRMRNWKCPGCGYAFNEVLVERAEAVYAAAADPKLPAYLVHSCGCRTLSRLDGETFRALTPAELLVLEVDYEFIIRGVAFANAARLPDSALTLPAGSLQ